MKNPSLEYVEVGKMPILIAAVVSRCACKWYFVRPTLRILIEFSLIFSKPEQGIRHVCRRLGSVNF
jgi:hypothetical protein